MADNSKMATTEARARPSPVLQPGRPADPTPPAPITPEAIDEVLSAQAPGAVTSGGDAEAPQAEGEAAERTEAEETPEDTRHSAMTRQTGHRRLLRQCERVLLLDFNTLAMPDWPDNFTMAAARRRRDIWLFSACLAAILFLAGIPGLAPAWVAGTGFGAFVLIVLAGVPFVRRLYNSNPSYLDLLLRRQHRMREARSHINHLEGKEGLAWQCAMMAEFNPALKSPRFSGLVNLSEKRILARELKRRDHIRLFLIYMLEAEKAYERLQQAYFDGHQLAIDNGWAHPEPSDIESELESTGEGEDMPMQQNADHPQVAEAPRSQTRSSR